MNTKHQNDCKLHKGLNTLNINGLNSPPKDTGELNGFRNKIHLYVVYKKVRENGFPAKGIKKQADTA